MNAPWPNSTKHVRSCSICFSSGLAAVFCHVRDSIHLILSTKWNHLIFLLQKCLFVNFATVHCTLNMHSTIHMALWISTNFKFYWYACGLEFYKRTTVGWTGLNLNFRMEIHALITQSSRCKCLKFAEFTSVNQLFSQTRECNRK